ncbi:MAG: hypothetical protein WBA35_09350 [Litorimonas sp.]
MEEVYPNLSVPTILVEGAAQDIVGIAALLENAEIGIALIPSISLETRGAITEPERLGPTTGVLHGDEIAFQLNPASNDEAVRYSAHGIIDRLNVLVAALDPNFEYVRGVEATAYPGGYYLGDHTSTVVVDLQPAKPERSGSTLGRHPSLRKSLKARQDLLWNDDYAALVMQTLAEKPTWNAIYAAFETMKTDLGVRKLHEAGLVTQEQEAAFGKAANNRTDRMTGSRHGKTKANAKHDNIMDQLTMMTLLEARELHRQAVHRYLDQKTGHTTGYEVVDNIGQLMRFGLAEWVRDLSV